MSAASSGGCGDWRPPIDRSIVPHIFRSVATEFRAGILTHIPPRFEVAASIKHRRKHATLVLNCHVKHSTLTCVNTYETHTRARMQEWPRRRVQRSQLFANNPGPTDRKLCTMDIERLHARACLSHRMRNIVHTRTRAERESPRTSQCAPSVRRLFALGHAWPPPSPDCERVARLLRTHTHTQTCTQIFAPVDRSHYNVDGSHHAKEIGTNTNATHALRPTVRPTVRPSVRPPNGVFRGAAALTKSARGVHRRNLLHCIADGRAHRSDVDVKCAYLCS